MPASSITMSLARASHLLGADEPDAALPAAHRALLERAAEKKPAADVAEATLREDLLRARLAVWLGLVETAAAARVLREQTSRPDARVADLLVAAGQLTLPQAARVEQCLSALPSACLRCKGAVDRFLAALVPGYACPGCGASVPSPLASAQAGSSATVLPQGSTPTPASKEEATVAYDKGVIIPMPGRAFGKYQIVSQLGRGGMGVVYKAVQTGIDRTVALKTLIAGPSAPEPVVKRFLREAASCAHLSHPNIVTVHDVGTEGGVHYFTMQYVEGKTLSQILKERKRLPAEEACRLVVDVARAVHYAHGKGVIHRDLKPSNILVDEAGHPHVMDFGLAKQIEGGADLTLSGTTLGTPSYMSPEQAGGTAKEIDARSDVYSIGAILYECLAGQKPFVGENDVQTIFKVVFEAPKPLGQIAPDVEPELEAVVMRTIDKDREKRYPSAWELASAIEGLRPRQEVPSYPDTIVRSRKRAWAVPLAAILVTCAAVALWKAWPKTVAVPAPPPAPAHDSARARALVDRAAMRPPADALPLLDQAIQLDPDLAEAYLERGHVRQVLGKNEEALADFDLAIAKNPSYLQALLHRALLLDRSMGRPDDAMKDYAKILELEPSSEVGQVATGFSLYQQAKWAKALPYFEKAVKLNDRDESAIYYLLWTDLNLQRYEEAEALGTKAIALFPASEVYLNLRGLSFYYRERWKEAQRDFEASLALNARNADSWCNLGLVAAAVGDDKKAYDCFTEGIAVAPKSALSYKNRAELLMRTERTEEALADVEKAVQLAPGDFYCHYLAGQVQMGLGHAKEAIKEFNEAIKLNPKSGSAYWNLATAYAVKMDIGSVGKAITYLEKALAADPRDGRVRTMFEFSQWLKTWGFKLMLAPAQPGGESPQAKATAKLRADLPKLIERLSKSRLPAQAVQYMDGVVGLDPTFADGYFLRGICWALAQEYDKALPDFEKAAELNAKMLPAKGMIASVALVRRDRKKALATYDDILSAETAGPAYRFLRGVARLDDGDKKGALADFAAVKDAPASGDAEKQAWPWIEDWIEAAGE